MTDFHHIRCLSHIYFFAVQGKLPETSQETVHAVNTTVIPLRIEFRRTYEQLIHTQRITSVIAYQIIRRYDVSFGFAHLDTILTSDHTLVKQLLEWFIKINHTDII